MKNQKPKVLDLDPIHRSTVEAFGANLTPLEPMGALVQGLDLAAKMPPPTPIIETLEHIMANRGFVVFRSEHHSHVR